jgi:hypothetical protein
MRRRGEPKRPKIRETFSSLVPGYWILRRKKKKFGVKGSVIVRHAQSHAMSLPYHVYILCSMQYVGSSSSSQYFPLHPHTNFRLSYSLNYADSNWRRKHRLSPTFSKHESQSQPNWRLIVGNPNPNLKNIYNII